MKLLCQAGVGVFPLGYCSEDKTNTWSEHAVRDSM